MRRVADFFGWLKGKREQREIYPGLYYSERGGYAEYDFRYVPGGNAYKVMESLIAYFTWAGFSPNRDSRSLRMILNGSAECHEPPVCSVETHDSHRYRIVLRVRREDVESRLVYWHKLAIGLLSVPKERRRKRM